MTEEQRAAFAQIKALAWPLRLRVIRDVEGFPVVPGRYGQIEWTGGPELAVYCNRPRLFRRLWAVPSVRPHQTGDTEMRALFLPEAITQVAALIRARRRRQGRPMSPEAAQRLRDARVGATSAAQERQSPVGAGTEKDAGRNHALGRVLARRPGEPAA